MEIAATAQTRKILSEIHNKLDRYEEFKYNREKDTAYIFNNSCSEHPQCLHSYTLLSRFT